MADLPNNMPAISVTGKDRNGNGCSVNCISVSGSLIEGIAPSAFTVETAFPNDDDPIPVTDVTLSFTDGINDTVTLSDMRLDPDSTRVNRSTTGLSVSLSYLDKRWKWAYSDLLDGEYNRRDEQGNMVFESVSDLKDLQALFTLITQAMGEEADLADIPKSGSDDKQFPYVKWDGESAQNVCADFAEKLGLKIQITTGGVMKILPSGGGVTLPNTQLRGYSLGLGQRPKPNYIQLYGGKNWYQMDLELEPVLQNANGIWQTYADYTYRPVNDNWTFALPQVLKGISKAAAYYCERTLFRCYRIKETIITIGDKEYSRTEACRRWIDNIVDTETSIEGVTTYKRAYAYGTYNTRQEFNDAHAFTNWFDRDLEIRELDRENGIVWFSEPILKVYENSESPYVPWTDHFLAPGTLTLRCAFEGERYYDSSPIINPNETFVGRMVRSELRKEFIDGQWKNSSILTPASEAAIAEEIARYAATAQPRVNTYGGIYNYYPDGDIESIQWQMGVNQLPETIIGYGISFRGQPRKAVRAALQAAGKVSAENIKSSSANRSPINSISLGALTYTNPYS